LCESFCVFDELVTLGRGTFAAILFVSLREAGRLTYYCIINACLLTSSPNDPLYIKLINFRQSRFTDRQEQTQLQVAIIDDRHSWLSVYNTNYKKAQLSLTNPHDAKACQNCFNSTCLQRCRWQYWPIFMRLTAIASEIREIPRNSLKIQTYGVQGHRRSSILVPIESPYVTCY